MRMLAHVIFNSNNKELAIEYLYTVENYFTFNIRVKSGEFSGSSSFCISKENIMSVIATLTKLYNELKGLCEINDYDSDAYIKIEMLNLGHVCIYGQIGGSHEDHSLKFKYIVDQTILPNLIQAFKSAL